jgi:hypothetical protein
VVTPGLARDSETSHHTQPTSTVQLAFPARP